MVTAEPVQRQYAIEENLLRICSKGIPEDRTVGETFGPLEEWFLEVAGHRLFLNPLLGEWFMWDTLHSSWERTGFSAGEALFIPFGKGVGAQMRIPPGVAAPSAYPAPPEFEDRWFYRDGALQIGPFSRKALADKLAKGDITPDTPVKKAGTIFWRRADWVALAPGEAGTEVQSRPAPEAKPGPPLVDSTLKFERQLPAEDATAKLPTLSLKAVSGPLAGKIFLMAMRGTAGRQSDNSIVLEEGHVSRHHAKFERHVDGSWWVEDLGSANGTFLNGKPLKEPHRLEAGDVVGIGFSDLKVQIGQDN